jgi:hypothetical protein
MSQGKQLIELNVNHDGSTKAAILDDIPEVRDDEEQITINKQTTRWVQCPNWSVRMTKGE